MRDEPPEMGLVGRGLHRASFALMTLATWTILVTNLPVERLTLEEALVLARARWQIELLFLSSYAR